MPKPNPRMKSRVLFSSRHALFLSAALAATAILFSSARAGAHPYSDSEGTTAGFGNATGIRAIHGFGNDDSTDAGAGTFVSLTGSTGIVNFCNAAANNNNSSAAVELGDVRVNSIADFSGQTRP